MSVHDPNRITHIKRRGRNVIDKLNVIGGEPMTQTILNPFTIEDRLADFFFSIRQCFQLNEWHIFGSILTMDLNPLLCYWVKFDVPCIRFTFANTELMRLKINVAPF